jgi:hypothetical protein
MKSTYIEIIDELTGNKTIQRTDENGIVSSIPCDLANSDYQRYLNPEAEQSTPSLTDEATTK